MKPTPTAPSRHKAIQFTLAWLATVVVSRLDQPSVTLLQKHQAVKTEMGKAFA